MCDNEHLREVTKKINEYKTVIASLKQQQTRLLNSKKPNKHTAAKCITIAIEAVEIQMPLKPTLEADGYADGELVYDIWYCPGCDTAYEAETEKYKYCPNCGQAIDWREE